MGRGHRYSSSSAAAHDQAIERFGKKIRNKEMQTGVCAIAKRTTETVKCRTRLDGLPPSSEERAIVATVANHTPQLRGTAIIKIVLTRVSVNCALLRCPHTYRFGQIETYGADTRPQRFKKFPSIRSRTRDRLPNDTHFLKLSRASLSGKACVLSRTVVLLLNQSIIDLLTLCTGSFFRYPLRACPGPVV